jgi:hypothetical protein
LNIFDRLKKKPTEEIHPSVQPPPLPEAAPPPDPPKPIRLNDEKYVLLLRALRPNDKVVRILKDLALDPLQAKAVVVGGASPSSPVVPPDESPGPIV